jgi:hypothetical protein
MVSRKKPSRKGRAHQANEDATPKEPSLLERQAKGMSLPQMIEELPKHCNVGAKKNSKGYQESWIGYKLHIDAADGGIPISCILTAASLHDSQAALPLAEMSRGRVTNLYDVMDSAYDAATIREHGEKLGHVPLIDINPRSKTLKEELEQGSHRREIAGYSRGGTLQRTYYRRTGQ